MKSVLCIGHAAYDITMPLNSYPKENSKMRIGKTVQCTGGASTNAGFLLSAWGIETYIVSVIGNDEVGKKIQKELEETGLRTEYLQVSSSFETTTSYIIANQENGSRTIVVSRTKQEEMLPVTYTNIPDGLILDGEELEESLRALQKFPEAISVLDAGNLKPAIVTLAKKVDYCITSRDFAEEYCRISLDPMSESDRIACYEKMKQDFQTNIIITLGEHGCFTKIEDDYCLIPSISVKAKDTTGSGDIYHGAFLYFLLQGNTLLEAMRYANITGALAATQVGRNHSIPKLKAVLEVDETDVII